VTRLTRAWRTAGLDDVAHAALARGLPASEVWTLLLDVLAHRAAERDAASLLRQWERDGFTRPAPVDQRTLVAMDGHLLAAAEGFEALELSPLAPLGACSVVGLASQNKIVSALRGTEVVSDPTNLMALECARRLHGNPRQVVRLATCHRCVRAQEIPNKPGFSRHFRIFCLSTAGREEKDHAFTVRALVGHIATHLAALDRLERHGYAFPERSLKVLAAEARSSLGDRVAASFVGTPLVTSRELLDHPYYDGLRFMIGVRAPDGNEVPLIDGGAFDWVSKLASNKKLVFVASGMGSQLAAHLFRRD
jgi:hypothetical protein